MTHSLQVIPIELLAASEIVPQDEQDDSCDFREAQVTES